MATVYLAHDVRHDRKVALKVLKPELAAVIGGARFLAEIKTTANLQNPHILPLHDSGEVDGTVFYVMPFIDGESLRDKLIREKQLPIPTAIRIATEIADALQYAHVHGVIHRDIKPENILIQDGHALVADFGIALAASSANSRMTETGMSLGTPHYMSPEQAMGERDLDARTDIYALGCVLYEMLTGQPPFTGPTAQAIVAKVITSEPVPPSKLRSSVDQNLEAAVLTALEKLPADRFATAAEFAGEIAGDMPGRATSHVSRRRAIRRDPWRRISAGLAVITLALAIIAGWALFRGGRTSEIVTAYDAALPDTAIMTFSGASAQSAYGIGVTNISVSSDGRFAVYPAVRGDSTVLWYRNLRDASGGPIDGTAGGAVARISPDGSRVAFMVGDRVMVVPFSGGTPKQLYVAGIPATLEWISATRLLVIHTDGSRMTWLDPESGATQERAIRRCTIGRWIFGEQKLVCSLNGAGTVLNPVSGEQRTIRTRNEDGSEGGPAQGSDFRFIDGRYVVYLSLDGELRAASYDAARQLIGRSVGLVRGIRREGVGTGQFDVDSAGALVYAPGENAGIGNLVTLRRGGTPQPLPVEPARFLRWDTSSDLRWLAAVIQGPQDQELRIFDLRDRQSFVWLRAPYVRHPLWSPDGRQLMARVLDSVSSAILLGSPASTRPPDTLMVATGTSQVPDPIDYHDDHTVVAMDMLKPGAVRFDPSVRPVRVDPLVSDARFTTISPNNTLIAYQTNDGRLMITRNGAVGQRAQVAARGVEPMWLSNTELVYRLGVSWFVIRIDPATGELAGSPVLWGRDPRFSDTAGWSNRLSSDGAITYLAGPEQSVARYIRVMPNWVARMKAAVDSVNR